MNNHGYPPLDEQECGNCRYSRATTRADDVLSCRCKSPWLTDLKHSDDDKTAWGWWPAVCPDFWCGEWAPQEVTR
jgi:hypothetical protein